MTTLKNRLWVPIGVPGSPNVASRYPGCSVVRGAIHDIYGSTDLNTRRGLPLAGHGCGIQATDSGNYGWGTAATPWPVTPTVCAYVIDLEVPSQPTARRYHLVNGSVAGAEISTDNGGLLGVSFDRVNFVTAAANLLVGRGRARVAGLYDGANQHLVINGTLIASGAVVPAAPNGYAALGEHGTIRDATIYSAQRTLAEDRADYVRDFARQVVWQWTPHREFASIATGTTGGTDDWWCPLGAATMGIVLRPDLSHPSGGRLALTDTQAVSLNRIEFPFRRPWFGSWLIEYEVRNTATDSMVVGFAPTRGADPTMAGSNAYWIHTRLVAGPWWRSSVYLANGAQIDAADAPTGTPIAGNRCKVMVSRAVNGNIQVWQQTPGGWWWSAAVGNDVNVLEEGFISLAPRGAYIERVTYYHGEMTPHELGPWVK